MALTAGIVGLPNVGKSTLFNAITKKSILIANYPFATIDPNVGMVTVPDIRLSLLEELFLSERILPTTFEFTDIAGLVKGASKGEGLGNKFLSNIREVDAVIEVVRCFDDPNIMHVEGNPDPIRDIEIIDLEFIFCDIEVITNRLLKIEKKALMTKDKEGIAEVDLLKKILNGLENNIPSRYLDYTDEETKILKPFNLLTQKPVIYVANISEENINNENVYLKQVKEYAKATSSIVIELCAKIESDLSELPDQEKKVFLQEIGLEKSGLDLLIKESYSLLGLETFFTAGPKEVRAWTFKKGMTAPECAGVIHSDFQKGFIRAEVISFEDMEKYGGEKECKEAGKLRIEGKQYIVKDGDVCHFRFNV